MSESFRIPALRPVIVDRLGQSQLEAGLMGAALHRPHIVGKGQKHRVIAVVILHGDLGDAAAAFRLHIDDLGMDHLVPPLVAEVGDKAPDTALKAEVAFPAAALGQLLPFVPQDDRTPAFRNACSRRRSSRIP